MDDFQFWLYLAFAAVYFISRLLKSKNPQQKPGGSRPTTSSGSDRRDRPMTFEELLREFTENKTADKEPEERPVTRKEPVEATELIRKRQVEAEQDFSSEGRNRQYTSMDDSESRRIYEESVRRAEGAALEFERDEHFTSRIRSRKQAAASEPSFAGEIGEMLRNQDGAKKAVILSELLNRKY